MLGMRNRRVQRSKIAPMLQGPRQVADRQLGVMIADPREALIVDAFEAGHDDSSVILAEVKYD